MWRFGVGNSKTGKNEKEREREKERLKGEGDREQGKQRGAMNSGKQKSSGI